MNIEADVWECIWGNIRGFNTKTINLYFRNDILSNLYENISDHVASSFVRHIVVANLQIKEKI